MSCPGCGGDHRLWIGWGAPGIVKKLMTECTRTQIELVPPIEIHGETEKRAFARWIEMYCAEAFRVHAEPQVVDASGWRDGLPAGI